MRAKTTRWHIFLCIFWDFLCIIKTLAHSRPRPFKIPILFPVILYGLHIATFWISLNIMKKVYFWDTLLSTWMCSWGSASVWKGPWSMAGWKTQTPNHWQLTSSVQAEWPARTGPDERNIEDEKENYKHSAICLKFCWVVKLSEN